MLHQKKAAEVMAYTYHYLYGIDVSVVRYFTVYGPAGRPDMSIFRFINGLMKENLSFYTVMVLNQEILHTLTILPVALF